jgi:hypothetical protein
MQMGLDDMCKGVGILKSYMSARSSILNISCEGYLLEVRTVLQVLPRNLTVLPAHLRHKYILIGLVKNDSSVGATSRARTDDEDVCFMNGWTRIGHLARRH